MYHCRMRSKGRLADTRSDGQGITRHRRRGDVCRFASLVEAQELARRLASARRLG